MRLRMRLAIGLGLLGVALCLPGRRPVRAQAERGPAPSAPALLANVRDGAASEPLGLKSLKVEATVAAFLARTRVTMTFANPHSRPLEGELVFPLPDGATVSGYALDIGGVLVDGVVVEKQEARVAFETEVRGRVDPGLVEWVKGNNFRTRVWPIPAGGTRTIRIEYVSGLVTEGHGDGRLDLYRLPLRGGAPVDSFELRVEVAQDGPAPLIRETPLAGVRFQEWQGRFVAETKAEGVDLKDDMLIALPAGRRETVIVEKDADGDHYFVVDDRPETPPRAATAAAAAKVGLVWDASLSRRGSVARELEIVRAWLTRLRDVEVHVTVLRDQAEPARTFTLREGDTGEIMGFLERVPYDGGTNLGLIPKAGGVSYSVLVSDGLGTIGTPRPIRTPLYALSADPRADHALLRHLAQASGGVYLDLTRLRDDAAVAAIGAPPYALQSVDHDPAAVADLLPSGALPVEGRVTISGRLLVPETRITLRYGGPGYPNAERAVTLRQANAAAADLAPRVWAQQKIASLSLFPERHHDELLALGRRFGVVTPGASLLVLEDLQQHLRYDIEPAPSRVELRAAYRKAVAERTQDLDRRKVAKLDQVVQLWHERVQWWERRFDVPKTKGDRRHLSPGTAEELDATGDIGGVEGGIAGGVPGGVVGGVVGLPASPPPPARAPAPMAAARSRNGAPADGAPHELMAADAEAKEEGAPDSTGGTIHIKAWDPATPYLAAMKSAGREKAYSVYLRERPKHADAPAFYLDCADHLLQAGQRALGRRVLTSVLELKLEDARLLRVAAHRLQQAGELDLAVELFEKVLQMRPEEPQSSRDLALALSARADARRASNPARRGEIAADYARALRLLNDVVLKPWDGRFAEIETIALMEANRIIAVIERETLPVTRIPIDPRLRRMLDVDVRVVMTWDTDNTDMDLWVTEPTGDKCYYGQNRTPRGGRMSHDFTGGYGPEEYIVRRGAAGEYEVETNFYGSRAPSLTGPTTVQATVFTNFGRPNERRETLSLRLGRARDVVKIGSVRFEGKPDEPAIAR